MLYSGSKHIDSEGVFVLLIVHYVVCVGYVSALTSS